MRIAQCLEAPLFNPGGVEVLVLELIRGLNAECIESLLVVPEELTDHQRKTVSGVKEIFVWDHTVSAAKESYRLTNWLRDNKAELAHFHLGGSYGWNARSWKGCPIPLISRSGIPCVTTNHGAFTIFDCVAPYRPLWFKILSLPPFWVSKLHQLTHAQWEATVSSHDLQAVRRWFFPARKKFLQLYHSKLHGDEFSTSTQITPSSLVQSPFILCLGTIGARKGQQYLVEAFLKIALEHPEWKLVVAGRQAHAPTLQHIKDQIASSDEGNRVIMMPDVDDAAAKTLLQRAAIFAIPSTGEGLGLSLQEAMYAGCACIGSKVGGIPDLIEDEINGLLVPPAQPSDLADGLARLMSDELLRKRLSEKAKASMLERKMTAFNMTQTYLELYKKVLGSKSLDLK
jgi:glycosyltransferase involved in cell wall biosynthesis